MEAQAEVTKSGRARKRAGTEGFAPDHSLPTTKAAAKFFDWGARAHPYALWPWNVVHRAINGRATTLSPKSAEVALLRSRGAAVRVQLQQAYGRGLVVEPQYGARATVSDEDVLRTEGPRVAGRVASAHKSAEAVMGTIDLRAVPTTEQNKPYLALGRALNAAVKTLAPLAVPDMIRGLLPPGRGGK